MIENYPFASSALVSFGVIALAEIGDKSQLVCMTLASKHRPSTVLLGAVAAFLVLNGLAVSVGAALASWVPKFWVTVVAAILFALWGIQALFAPQEQDEIATGNNKVGRSLLITTFAMIFLAELGDKTQMSVAAMATTHPVSAVWLGSSLALIGTSCLGVLAGKHLLAKIDSGRLNRASGLFFLTLSGTLLFQLGFQN